MITDDFDVKTEPIIFPNSFYGEKKYICDVCVIIFSKVIFEHIITNYSCEKIAEINACNGDVPIYAFEFREKKIAFYLSAIGSAVAATYVTEVHHLVGAQKFVMFGSAGSLNHAETTGKFVVPTAAYRGEGMSYYYAAPADYIDVAGAETVSRVFDVLNVPYVKGKVWTTDAFYRETQGLMQKRVEEGCLAVEMELAGVQAVCSFYGFQLYDFLVTGDVLDASEYSSADLYDANHSLDKWKLALEIALHV